MVSIRLKPMVDRKPACRMADMPSSRNARMSLSVTGWPFLPSGCQPLVTHSGSLQTSQA
jgi:hypothetical protein